MRYDELYNVIKPSVPCIEIGGVLQKWLTESDWTPFLWYETYYCTSDFEYREDINLQKGVIHVYTTGIYRIDFEIALLVSDSYEEVITAIFVNDIVVPGSYSDAWYGGVQQINSSKIVYLKNGDVVDFRVFTTYYSVETADWWDEGSPPVNRFYSRARITYIPSGGWNNNSGGNVVNRGVRR